MKRSTPDSLKSNPHSGARVNIDTSRIDRNALRVISGLHAAGFQAYLVGGGVRDLLLGLSPKDFDIATDAHPKDVRRLFDNSRVIGRRFRIVHVYGSKGYVEVATFRAAGRAHVNQKGRILTDNIYGSIDEDAFRRDFTANALYYDPDEGRLLDLVGGRQDLDARLLRVIGDPDLRFREDPVRMLRAIRLAVKLDFKVEKRAEETICRLGHLLSEVPSARLFDEILKLFHAGFAVRTFSALREYGLFQYLFPMTEKALEDTTLQTFTSLVYGALQNTDERVRAGKPVTPSFLYAVFLWGPMRILTRQLELDGLSPKIAHDAAMQDTIISQLRYTSIPKRMSHPMRDMWDLQYRFYRKRGKQVFRLYQHARFRAAYDFLCLRAQAGEPVDRLCEWWTVFQDADEATQRKMVRAPGRGAGKTPFKSGNRTYH
ncbi:MAG: polynucleotide adenylyltransferase PcnB [Gammaproteobacteria bacterium]|nr:polynucleotide adenylyltransferase PcnB [Gammaproteobacteria bacterium]